MAENGVRSLNRALDILETLREYPMRITDLARRCHLSKSTVHRLLSSLQARGYVVQDPATERYALGLVLIGLGNPLDSHSVLLRAADPVMRDLVQRTGESVRLAVREEDYAIILHHVEGTLPIRFVGPVGIRLPMHATAVGKVFLASMPLAEVEETAHRTGLPAYGPNSIADTRKLLADVQDAQRRGYAINDEEHFAGGRAVAAPIWDARGLAYAALVIIGPTDRIRLEALADWGKMIVEAGDAISRALGWRGNPPRQPAVSPAGV